MMRTLLRVLLAFVLGIAAFPVGALVGHFYISGSAEFLLGLEGILFTEGVYVLVLMGGNQTPVRSSLRGAIFTAIAGSIAMGIMGAPTIIDPGILLLSAIILAEGLFWSSEVILLAGWLFRPHNPPGVRSS
jgi:hypothetical protein